MPAPGRRQARLMNKFDTQYLIVGLLIAGAILFLDPFDFPIVDAQESNTVIGKNYNDVLLSVDADGKETHKVSKTPQRISTDGKSKGSKNKMAPDITISFDKPYCLLPGASINHPNGIENKTIIPVEIHAP